MTITERNRLLRHAVDAGFGANTAQDLASHYDAMTFEEAKAKISDRAARVFGGVA